MRLIPVSHSKLERWRGCPRRFLLQDLQGRKAQGTWAHFSFANAIHRALKLWWDEPAERRTPQRGAELVAHAWSQEGFADAEQADRWRLIASSMVSAYVSGLDPEAPPHSTERNLAARTDTIAISGRIDCLDELPDGSLAVIDYKTGKGVPTQDTVRSSQQLAMYALCVRQSLKRDCSTAAIHHIPSGVRVSWDYTPESLDRHIGRIERVAVEMDAAAAAWRAGTADINRDFPVSTGSICGFCDMRPWCPEGQAAAEAKPPWAAMPEDPGAYFDEATSAQNDVTPSD